MKIFFSSVLFLTWVVLFSASAVVFADTCPDPQEVKGGNLPPNWDEMDRPLNYASYFGEVANNLEYVERFDRVEIDNHSAICRYYPNVSLQKFGSFEPVNKSMWREKEFVWTCTNGWSDCEFE